LSFDLANGLWVACSNADEETVAVSKPEESQSINLDGDVHLQKSYDLDHSPAFDAMLCTLLPEYLTSQQPAFNSARESSLPSRSNSLLVEPSLTLESSRMEVGQSDRIKLQASLDSDYSGPETHRQDPPGASSTVDPFDRLNDCRIGTTRRGTWTEGLPTDQQPGISNPPSQPGAKPKRSYKDLINQMLNYK